MKKVFVSMMLATALLVGGSAYAQTKADGATGATSKKTEHCGNCQQGEHKGDKAKSGKAKGNKPAKAKFNPFDGIQLTADQQQKLQVLQQGLGPVQLTPEQQAKIPQNPNLTPEQKKQLKAERKAKKLEAKKNYLTGVKETLSPDQYVVFLENWYLYSPQAQKDKAAKHDGKHKKDKKDKKGKKGQRPQGQRVAQPQASSK